MTYAPLLHLFLGASWLEKLDQLADDVTYEPYVLFFGRLERYKGVVDLVAAWARLPDGLRARVRLVLAGPGQVEKLWTGQLPSGIEVRNQLIQDKNAIALFKHCALLVLPYIGATQSALIPAAYFFHKPVLATMSGALREYVEDGETGWLVEPKHPPSLARALTTALSDFDRLERMGNAGRRWYDEQRVIESTAVQQMYTQLAGRSATT